MLNHQEKLLPISPRRTSCAVKKQKHQTLVSSNFFQGQEKASEHLSCEEPPPRASGHSSATPIGQWQILPVSDTTTLPARTSTLPALQHPKMKVGCSPQGLQQWHCHPKHASGHPSQCHPLVALTLAAQSQPRQLPVRQLMTEVHNPDGDVHLQQQATHVTPLFPLHTCMQPCKAAESLYLSGNSAFLATPAP